MRTAIDTTARVIFETWGGPWAVAPEFRKAQARIEASKVLEALLNDAAASQELILILTDGSNHAAIS